MALEPGWKAQALSPIIPVANIEISIRFYESVLGFQTVLQLNGYAVLTRDNVSLHITRADDPSVLEATRGHLSFYLEIQGIETLWPDVVTFKDRYKIRDLFKREYGMQEFHIEDPDGCLIFVGEQIAMS